MSSVSSNLNELNDRLPKFSQSPLRVVLEASNRVEEGNGGVLITDLGLDQAFIDSTQERVLEVLSHTGKPKLNPEGPGPAVKVFLEGPIISYNMIVGDNGNFRFVAIGCTQRTHYVVVRGNVSFAFYVPEASTNMREAVLELLYNNLIKGPRIYIKTAMIITSFFEKIMQAVFPDPVELVTTIRSAEGEDMPCRIYFDPDAPQDAMISVGGYVYGYDLNVYPKAQINKTLRVIERNERRDRRATPRSPADMNFRERAQQISLLEKALAGTTVDELAGTTVSEDVVQLTPSR
jgi:hypothetical protein